MPAPIDRSRVRGGTFARIWIAVCSTIVLLVTGVALAPSALAVAGDLDPSFGGSGWISAPVDRIGSPLSWSDNAVAVQSDGAVVWGGGRTLLRSTATGAPDATFGTNGRVTAPVWIADLAVQSSGGTEKIVIAGTEVTSAGGTGSLAVARYNRNGTLDTSFGTGGIAAVDRGPTSLGSAVGVVVDRSGSIVVGGWLAVNPHQCVPTPIGPACPRPNWPWVLTRFTADGAIDRTFGTGGLVATVFPEMIGIDPVERLGGIALQPDGKIVAAGTASSCEWCATREIRFAAARYLPNGAPDPTFGTGGLVTTAAGEGHDVVVQPDGKIVLTGTTSSAIAVLRFLQDGTLDPAFGVGGKVVTPLGGHAYARAVTLQPDGRIVVAGRASLEGADGFAILRYLPDGSPDPSFGTAGKVLPPFVGHEADDLILQRDGRILASGFSSRLAGAVVVTRLFAASPPDTVIDSGPPATTTSSSATFTFHATQSGSTFECRVDAATFAPCVSPKSYSGLSAGGHRFEVRASAGGNIDPTPATHSWTIQSGGGSTCTITGTSANDTLTGTSGSDVICGLGGADTISGLGASDTLVGGDGPDILTGGAGSDTIDGGTGADTASYGRSGSGAVVDLSAPAPQASADGTGGQDTLSSIERLLGSAAAGDRLTGSSVANRLDGQGGRDQLYGLGGDDSLLGGKGDDHMDGGDGSDQCSDTSGTNTRVSCER